MSDARSAGGAKLVLSPHDVLNELEQAELRAILIRELERYLASKGKSNTAGLYFLVAFTWGWARRVAWSTEQLRNYAGHAWEVCKRVSNEGPRKLWTPKGGNP
jgi:hypothetical protein